VKLLSLAFFSGSTRQAGSIEVRNSSHGSGTVALHFVVPHGCHVRNVGDNWFDFVHVIVPHILVAKLSEATSMKERIISLAMVRKVKEGVGMGENSRRKHHHHAKLNQFHFECEPDKRLLSRPYEDLSER
jgi:hypothetical protein